MCNTTLLYHTKIMIHNDYIVGFLQRYIFNLFPVTGFDNLSANQIINYFEQILLYLHIKYIQRNLFPKTHLQKKCKLTNI